MKTGYLTVLHYNDGHPDRIRFWDTAQEAEAYKGSLTYSLDKSVEILGPVTINPAWIDANGLILPEDFKLINVGPPPAEPATGSAWVRVEDALPESGEWVLHAYKGVRPPEYGLYRRGAFWRDGGPESFPTTHWLRVPRIDEPAPKP